MRKKEIRYKIFIFVGGIFIALAVFLYVFFYSTFSLPKGNLYKRVYSPRDTYKALVSIVESEKPFIRVDIINNTTNKKRLIYWSWNEGEDPQVNWLNEENILINGTKLNVKKDKYDKRYMEK